MGPVIFDFAEIPIDMLQCKIRVKLYHSFRGKLYHPVRGKLYHCFRAVGATKSAANCTTC